LQGYVYYQTVLDPAYAFRLPVLFIGLD
jgi:hypothetical protein